MPFFAARATPSGTKRIKVNTAGAEFFGFAGYRRLIGGRLPAAAGRCRLEV